MRSQGKENTTSAQTGGGAEATVPADFVVQFSEIVSSTVSPRTGAVQLGVTGIAGMDATLDTAIIELENPESVDDAEQYSAPGIIGRPLPPETSGGITEHMDVCCIRTADGGLTPISYRDNRLTMGADAPGEGVLAFVGYGGGFHSMTPVADGDDADGGGTIHVLYCPYDFQDGVAQKAHSIILDPTPGNESIIIAHAEGMAITMLNDSKKALMMKNAAGDATFRLDDDGITATAQTIVLSGGVIVGDPFTALPLLPGAASQGSTVFFLSP